MNLQENITRIKQMMSILYEDNTNSIEYILNKINLKNTNNENSHLSAFEEVKKSVNHMLNFYIKVDGKYYDKEKYKKNTSINTSVDSLPKLIEYFKGHLESIKFNAEQTKKWTEDLIVKYNEIIKILNDFFSPIKYSDMETPTYIIGNNPGRDHFTNIPCNQMNPKSPSCRGKHGKVY